MSKSITFKVNPGGSLQGEARVPGDKSVSHRSIMLGSLAEGVTHVKGFLEAEDALATLQAFRDMGVKIEGPVNGELTIYGVGKHGLKAPEKELYLGNSGTSMRLLSGLLSGQAFDSVLTGDKSLSGRPMKRVTEPLKTMGAEIKTTEKGTAPLYITGKAGQMQGIDYTMPMASAQVKSCLLLAGMYAQGDTSVTEPAPTRDHTERMLSGFNYPVKKRRQQGHDQRERQADRLRNRRAERHFLGRVFPGRRVDCAGFRSALEACRHQSDPHRRDRHLEIDGREDRSFE